jgi:integrase/recombinase XerC/integrase/recombinase XerD
METTIPVLIDLFAATKQTENKSKATVAWYRQRLGNFSRFVGEEATLPQLNINTARAFIASLQDRTSRYEDHPIVPPKEGGLSPFYIHSHVRALKSFSSWLYDEGFTRQNVLSKLKRPTLPKPVINILTDEEIDRLLNSINPNTFLGMRLMCILLLFLDTGMRASELLGITMESIDWSSDTIRIWGKGRKERIVSFDPQTKKYLLRYVQAFRPEPQGNCQELFLSVEGTALTYNALSHLIKRTGEGVDIPRLHAHLLRHTFAVKYLMLGGDIITLKMILGHTDITVTQLYLHLAQSHVKVQHERFSPVSRIKIGGRRKRS